MLAWLQQRLNQEGLVHSLGVQRRVADLAHRFKFSPDVAHRASLAALLHDCASQISTADLRLFMDDSDNPPLPFDRQSAQTLHPFVAAAMVRRELDIHDKDCLEAIRFCTTARPRMSVVEKLVFMAHKLEEHTTNPLYQQKMMSLLDFRNSQTLDIALLYVLDSSISYLISKGQLIHPRTIDARNDLLSQFSHQHIPYPHR